MRPLKSIFLAKIFTYMNNAIKIKLIVPFFLLFTCFAFGQSDKEKN
jgi:hypothetical protein